MPRKKAQFVKNPFVCALNKTIIQSIQDITYYLRMKKKKKRKKINFKLKSTEHEVSCGRGMFQLQIT